MEVKTKIPTQTSCLSCKKIFICLFSWYHPLRRICDTCRKKGHREP